MENWAAIIAGLGLFIIGVKQVGHHLKQMAGHRMRAVMARATRNRLRTALLGVLAGALTQSTNAATFLVVSMVTAGIVEVSGALPIAIWSNVGTSALVMMATLDMRLLAFFMIGLVGLCYYGGLHEHEKWRHLIGASLAVCLLFLGLSLVKSGTAPLRHEPWVVEFLRFASGSFGVALFAGAVMTLVAQSSATVSVVALTLLASDLLTMDQTIMLVFGASLGSGANIYMLAMNLTGTGRVIALMQVWLKGLGVLLLLPVFLCEIYAGWHGIKVAAGWLGATPQAAVAWVYLFLQLVPALVMTVFSASCLRLARRFCPPDPSEELARPAFIYDQALEETETALDLVEREQVRLIERLPRMLETLITDGQREGSLPPGLLHASGIALMSEIASFMDALMLRCQTHAALERLVNSRARQDILEPLYDNALALSNALSDAFSKAELQGLGGRLVEGLHAVLCVFAESAASDPGLIPTVQALTSDRSELMKQLRSGLVETQRHLAADAQANLFTATSLFDRVIWLVHRFSGLMEQREELA